MVLHEMLLVLITLDPDDSLQSFASSLMSAPVIELSRLQIIPFFSRSFFLFLHNYRRSRADVNRYGVVKGLGHCSIFKSFLSEIRLNTVSAGKEQSV